MNCTTSPEFENNNIIQPNSAKVCLLYLKTLAALQTGKKRQNATSEKWLTPVSLLKRKISVSSLSKICAVQLIILAWQKTSNAFVEVRFKGLVLYQVAYTTFYYLNDFLSLIEQKKIFSGMFVLLFSIQWQRMVTSLSSSEKVKTNTIKVVHMTW